MDREYLECSCGCCVLSVFHDDWDEYTAFVWLIIHGEYSEGWRDRIRQAWRVIRYGHAHNTREILFRKAAAIRLGNLLLAHAEAIPDANPDA